jgi:hypothetical protein
MPNEVPNVQMSKRHKSNFSLFGFRHSFVSRHSDFVIALIFYDYEQEHEHEHEHDW